MGNKTKTIVCAFCQGTGNNPHFSGTCPVCKGKGENIITGPFMACSDCHGTGQKRGTSLTCYSCGGLGVAPDTSKIFKKAKKEIEKARKEMDKERRELTEKSQPASPAGRSAPPHEEKNEKRSKNPGEKLFCQCCGKKTEKRSTAKVCLDCIKKIKDPS